VDRPKDPRSPGSIEIQGAPQTSDPTLDVPDLDLRPRMDPAPKAKRAQPSSSSRPPGTTSSQSHPPGDFALEDKPGSAVRIELDAPLAPPPAFAPARATRMLRDDPEAFAPQAKRGASFGKLLLSLFLSLVIAGGAIVYEAPDYTKQRIGASAKRSGLVVAIGQIVFRPRELVLLSPKVTVLELPNVTLGVGEVEIALEGIEPKSVSIRGFEIRLTGSLSELYVRAKQWASALPAPLRFEARSGSIHALNPWGAGTEIEATDVTLSTRKGLSVESPSVLAAARGTKLGPWKLSFEETSDEARLNVGLDPASPASAFTASRAKDGRVSFAMDVAPSPLSRIGIPPESLGFVADPHLELHLSLSSNEPPRFAGQSSLVLSDLRAALPKVAGVPADVQLMGGFVGVPAESLNMTDGLVAFGATKGKAMGSLVVGDSSIRLDLAFQWPPSAKAVLPSTFRFDTRDLGGHR
jgi:hypothetical protein